MAFQKVRDRASRQKQLPVRTLWPEHATAALPSWPLPELPHWNNGGPDPAWEGASWGCGPAVSLWCPLLTRPNVPPAPGSQSRGALELRDKPLRTGSSIFSYALFSSPGNWDTNCTSHISWRVNELMHVKCLPQGLVWSMSALPMALIHSWYQARVMS